MNFRYPIFIDLTGKNCLVTGEGFEMAQKVQGLVDASANVLYINPQADPKIEALFEAGLIRWERRVFQPDDLDACFLVITDSENNADVFHLAEERHILCNSVDDPPNCRFSFGSVHRQGDLTVAISTNGLAPALAVRLRQKLEREVGVEYGSLLALLKTIRPEIMSRVADFEVRRDLWYRIVDSDVLQMIREGHTKAALAKIKQMIDETANSTSRSDTSAAGGGR